MYFPLTLFPAWRFTSKNSYRTLLQLPPIFILFFFFNDPPPPEFYTLSLHDALPVSRARAVAGVRGVPPRVLPLDAPHADLPLAISLEGRRPEVGRAGLALCRQSPHLVCLDFLAALRSEEHTSELQSQSNLVCRLLLE